LYFSKILANTSKFGIEKKSFGILKDLARCSNEQHEAAISKLTFYNIIFTAKIGVIAFHFPHIIINPQSL
jgi:hypothetical protein